MRFLTEKARDAMLFLRPLDGMVVRISPPGLAWLPAEGASGYRVEIQSRNGLMVYEKTIGSDPVHLPNQVLEPGDYVWDVVALDDAGEDAARRGELSFTIAVNVPDNFHSEFHRKTRCPAISVTSATPSSIRILALSSGLCPDGKRKYCFASDP